MVSIDISVVALLVDAAVLAFVVYAFVAERWNRPSIRIEQYPGYQEKDEVYDIQWFVKNKGHGVAKDVRVMFRFRGEDTNTRKEDLVVTPKQHSVTSRDDLVPITKSGNSVYLDFCYKKGAEWFVLQTSTEALEEGKLKKIDGSHPLPVGKYSVTITVSGENLRSKDREPKELVLEFVDGAPKVRPRTKDDHYFAKMVEVNIPLPKSEEKRIEGQNVEKSGITTSK